MVAPVGQNFIPDVMVYAATDERTKLTTTPVLAVEVLSSRDEPVSRHQCSYARNSNLVSWRILLKRATQWAST